MGNGKASIVDRRTEINKNREAISLNLRLQFWQSSLYWEAYGQGSVTQAESFPGEAE